MCVQVESQRRYYEQQDSARAAAPPAKAESKPAGENDLELLRGRVTELQVGKCNSKLSAVVQSLLSWVCQQITLVQDSLAAAQKDKKRAESNAEALKSQARVQGCSQEAACRWLHGTLFIQAMAYCSGLPGTVGHDHALCAMHYALCSMHSTQMNATNNKMLNRASRVSTIDC